LSETITDIESRVPHAGDMVLINEVRQHDEHTITCRARTGPLESHPLGRKGRLPATALAEYGAQAMAVHGGLLAAADAPPREGRLVSLGELSLSVPALEEPTELTIRAERVGGSVVGEIYRFEVLDETRTLASGQATVMFPNPGEAA
jgi:predicted hotdog family 3-hydroxylacyl-ACP dehydratase